MKYIVYKTTNLINGKIYVGVHRTNPDIFDGYIGCGVTKKDQKKHILKGFPRAVAKYGYKNFKRETLFVFPDTEEGMKEAYAKEAGIVTIQFVKRTDTYNLICGGKCGMYSSLKKEIAQYTIEGKFIRTWDSIIEAQEALNLNSISSNLIGKSKYCGDFQWKYYTGDTSDIEPVETKEKTVYQFDLQGNLLKRWKSVTEASKQFSNPSSARSAITNNCIGKTNQSFGYFWSYKNKFELKVNKHYVAVAKYDDEGNFIESYTSIQEAANKNNIKTSSNIINAIKGYQKRCGGFRWRYFYGNVEKIKPL